MSSQALLPQDARSQPGRVADSGQRAVPSSRSIQGERMLASGSIFESIGKIEDGATGVAHGLPVVARAIRVGSKEREVDAIELFVANALDKSDFVAHGFQLSERLRHRRAVSHRPQENCGRSRLRLLLSLSASAAPTMATRYRLPVRRSDEWAAGLAGVLMRVGMLPDRLGVQAASAYAGKATSAARICRKACRKARSRKVPASKRTRSTRTARRETESAEMDGANENRCP